MRLRILLITGEDRETLVVDSSIVDEDFGTQAVTQAVAGRVAFALGSYGLSGPGAVGTSYARFGSERLANSEAKCVTVLSVAKIRSKIDVILLA